MSYDFDEDQITLYVKGSNISEIGQFLTTTDNIYISFYPNNSNDFLYDDYSKSIILGALNCNNFYQGYIAATSNNDMNTIMSFDENKIISYVDIIPSTNDISLGNSINKWKNLYINSNIYIGNIRIYSEDSSNIVINGTLNSSNINNSSLITANNIDANYINVYSNIKSLNTITDNIYSSNLIETNFLITSNITANNVIITNTIINNNIYVNNTYSSNILNYNSIDTKSIYSSNLTTNFINSSNIYIYDTANIKNLYVKDTSYLNGSINIINDFIPNSNNFYNLGSINKKWKNIYITSNLYIGNTLISFIQSNIILSGDIYASNIIANNNITTSNIYIYNNKNSIYVSGNLISKDIINNNTIYSKNILTSNTLKVINTIYSTNIINSNNIYTDYIVSSNTNNGLYVYGNTIAKNINTNNIISSNIISSNMIIYNTLSVKDLIVNNITSFNSIILNNNFISTSNNLFNIGSYDFKFKNIYLGSNIFLGNSKIYSYNSNIYIDSDIYTNNLFSKNINANNLKINNITAKGTLLSEYIINSNNIYTNSLITSNIISYDNIYTNDLITNNIKTSSITSSNINVYKYIITESLNSFNINSKYISTSNIFVRENIQTAYLNVSNILKLQGTSIISSDLIPSKDSIYSLGSYNLRWKDLYLSSGSLYLDNIIISGDDKYGGIKLTDINNNYQQLTVSSIKLTSDTSNYVIISTDNNGLITFINNSNNSSIGISYKDLVNTPYIYIDSNTLFSSNNFIFNKTLISSNNTILYGNVGINKNNPKTALDINGTTFSTLFQGSFIGDGYGLSNIIASNILGIVDVSHGGSGCNILPYGQILIGNNKNPVITSPNLIWSNNDNSLNVKGSIYANNIQGSFIGDGSRISNINANNIIGKLNVSNGGTGCNIIPYGSILIGNNKDPIITTSNFVWSNITNTLNVYGVINVNTLKCNNISSINNILIGNGSQLNNIISSNIIGIIDVINGGSGCNLLPYGSVIIGNNNNPVITTTDLIWSNVSKTLYVNGNINSSKIQGSFIGNGENISNIIASNIIGVIDISHGGTGCNFLPVGQVIIGNDLEPVITTTNLTWSSSTNSLNINGSVYANTIQGSFIGDGSGLSNIITSNIKGILPVLHGGTGCNILHYGQLLVGNNKNPIITSPNLVWSNTTNTLNVNGSINANILQGAFIGNGSGISNIIASNINGIISVSQGGTGRYNLPYNRILIGNNNNPVTTSDNFIWTNSINNLNIRGSLNAYSIQGSFIGDGSFLSNINANNIVGAISVKNGGTGCNTIPYGKLLIGNDNDTIITTNNLYWDPYYNKLNIIGLLQSDNISGNNIYANSIQGSFIGNGSGLSNIVSSNIIGVLSVSQGGTGINNLPYGSILVGNDNKSIITSTNLSWSNTTNTLNIKGSIYANNIQGSFIGDGKGLSNIIASNIIGIVDVLQGGTGCNNLPYGSIIIGNDNSIITSTNLVWSNTTNTLNIKGSIYADKIQGSFIGDGKGLSNIVASNIIGIVNVLQGGTGCNILPYGSILVGNNNDPVITSPNFIWSNTTNSLNINGNIYANNIQGSFNGDGKGLSNISASNIIGIINVSQGGTGCNILPYGNILVGNNNNPIITSANFIWSNTNNTLKINGSINANTIQSSFIGDGSGISNIISSNIIGILSVSQGGTGCNILPYGSVIVGNNNNTVITSENLIWSNITNTLNIKGSVYANTIQGSFIGDGSAISNIVASNIIGVIDVLHGGTGCNIIPYGSVIIGNNNEAVITTPNLIWSNITKKLNVKGSIYSDIIQGSFIGDGSELSNISASNIIGIINVSQGGTGCNLLPYGSILVGNNNNPVITSTNLIWSNTTNTLKINGNINANTIEGSFIGDGKGLSNISANNIIGIINVSQGGTGCNILPYGSVIIGNNKEAIITSKNLIWSNITNTLHINGNINANIIQGLFIGDGSGISNIVASNIIGNINVLQGGTGCNILPYENLLIGNNKNPIITTSDLKWNTITKTLMINGNIISSNINANKINSDYLYSKIIQGRFIGDGSGLSNIITSNLIGTVSVINGGTGRNILPYGQIIVGNNNNSVITSPNLIWSNTTNTLNVNGNINSSKISGKFVGNGSGLLNIISSNILGIINISNGGTGCNILPYGSVLIGNNNNPLITSSDIIWSNVSKKLIIKGDINASNFEGKFNGSFYGFNFSYYNASNILGVLPLEKGGTGCNIIPYGEIILGNYSNAVITTSKLYWNNVTNNLIINGNVFADTIDANIFASNIIGIIPISNGGTGCNILPLGQLLIGNNKDALLTTNKLLWNKNNELLNINGDVYANNIQGSFVGDGSGLSNVNINNIKGNIPVINGGTGGNFFTEGNLLIGNKSDPLISSSKLYWNNNTNTLHVNGRVFADEIFADLIGDGSGISNIVASNLIGILPVSKGGIGTTFIATGEILLGNNYEKITSSSDFTWNNAGKYLYVNGDVYANTINAENIHSFNLSNVVGNIDVINGGTGCNTIPYGQIVVGNNERSIITSPNFVWSNITNELFINGDISANNFKGSFIGDGINIYNIVASNIIGTISILNGGTGCNNLPYGSILVGNNDNAIITSTNLIWSNTDNKLVVKGDIYANNIQGSFIGDGMGLSNIMASNIGSGILAVKYGGLGCNNLPYGQILVGNNTDPILTSPNFTWNETQKKININGNLYANNIKGKFYGDGRNISNIVASNIIGILNISQGGTGCNILPYGNILIGNNTNPLITTSNLLWINDTNTLNINGNIIGPDKLIVNNSIYSSITQSKFYGDGTNISNIVASNIIGLLSIENGGTGCNLFNFNEIILGNNNKPLITYSELKWDNSLKELIVSGNVIGDKIQGKFYGDGTNISNFIASNLFGEITVAQGGTGCNIIPKGQLIIGNDRDPIITSPYLIWDNTSNSLTITGDVFVNNIRVNKNIYADSLPAGKFIGDAANVSNFMSSNIIGTISVINGGTGRSSLPATQLLIGNNDQPLTSSELLYWNDSTNILTAANSTIISSYLTTTTLYTTNLNIIDTIDVNISTNNTVLSKSIQGKFYGDGLNISNFVGSNLTGVVSVINGGTGCNSIPYGQLVIGNNNAIITTSNLMWNNITNELNINGNINANNINIRENIYANNIQGKFYGDGTNISNIVASNIVGPGILSVINGGTGYSSIENTHILIGNGSSKLLTTPNFTWDNDTNILIANGTIYTNTINTKNAIYCTNLNISGDLFVDKNVSKYIFSRSTQGKFIGDGTNLSNLISSNLVGVVNVINGGTGCNSISRGQLIIGNNSDPITTTSNLYWDEGNHKLNINGDIYAENAFLNGNLYANNVQGKFYGDGTNISNIIASNISGNGILSLRNGGTGYSSLPINQILIGNNTEPLFATPNFTWDELTTSLNIAGTIYTNDINVSSAIITNDLRVVNDFTVNKSVQNSIYSKIIQSKFIGDGTNVSNFIGSNISGIVSVINGGTGCNSIPYGQIVIGNNDNTIITTSNLMWDNINNNLIINGNINTNNIYNNDNIYSKTIQGKFIGNGANISNIGANNLSGIVTVSNGGTGMSSIISKRILYGNDTQPMSGSDNFIWDNNSSLLAVNGTINTINLNSSVSIYSSSINIFDTIIANKGSFISIYSTKTEGKFIGDGNNISNLNCSNLVGILSVIQGGTGCNIIPSGQILIGNNSDPIISTQNLIWNNNRLNINGDINANNINLIDNLYAKNITGKFYGDGANISNIIASNISGNSIISVTNGGTGKSLIPINEILIGNNTNPIYTTPNLTWDSELDTLITNGIIYTNIFNANNSIYTTSLYSDNVTVINANINKLYTNTIQGSFSGDGSGLSNIRLDNVVGTLQVYNGGTGRNYIPDNEILIGNNSNAIITSSNLIWNNNKLKILGDIYANNLYLTSDISANYIQGKFYGDGANISNLNAVNIVGNNIIPVTSGGTGYSSIPINRILVGNNSSALINTDNFTWNDVLNTLNINGTIYTNDINIKSSIFGNALFITNELNANNASFNSLYANEVKGNFIGDGSGISNILTTNITGIVSVSGGGTGCNSFINGHILIGNNTNPILTSSNLIWDNKNKLNINGDIYANNLYIDDTIYGNIIQGKFYGDGTNISNIIASNLIGSSLIPISNGGTGLINIPSYRILIGNDNDPILTSDNLLWINDSLYLNGYLYTNILNSSSTIFSTSVSVINTLTANKGIFDTSINSGIIQGNFYGDGANISNISGNNIKGSLSVDAGGTGCNLLPYGQLLIGNDNKPFITTSNLLWDNNILNVNGNIISSNITIYNKLSINNFETSNLNTIGWDSVNKTYNGIKFNNKPFYISLYLSNNINSVTQFYIIPFKVNYSNNGGMNSSSSNIEPTYWNNNRFIIPVNGLYSINYSACCTTPNCFIWINKTTDLTNNYNNRFGVQNSYGQYGCSTSFILNGIKNDNYCFVVYNAGNVLINNDFFGNTKASISLLQQTQ